MALGAAFEGASSYTYQAGRGHPDFGLKKYGGIVVRRPTASPSIVRDMMFDSVEQAADYIRSLPAGAAYDCRPMGGYDDGGLCEYLESVGVAARTGDGVFPWEYWPTEAERADPVPA